MSLLAAQYSCPAWLTCPCAALQVERAAFKYVLRSRNSLSDQEIHSSDLPPGLKLDSFQVGSLAGVAAVKEAAHRHKQLPVGQVCNLFLAGPLVASTCCNSFDDCKAGKTHCQQHGRPMRRRSSQLCSKMCCRWQIAVTRSCCTSMSQPRSPSNFPSLSCRWWTAVTTSCC